VYSAVHSGKISMVLGMVITSAAFRLGSIFAWLTWSLGLLYELAGYSGRVFEYVDLPAEESEERREPRPTASTTTEIGGDISFVNYSMSYRPSTPRILENLSLTIKEGSKVGLIGRTGSGKSSIVQALFRMVYVQGGDILVGSTSLFALPVRQARGLFAVVTQDPYLFAGTVRSNLDRSGEYPDESLRHALQAVQLKLELDTVITEGGINLSQGERQLVCLARCILTSKPYIIMDEPTSGVDVITDSIIQSVLRTALADRTVITIAHRLETLARVDRIIELHQGAVVRDGTPDEIIPIG
jgi:ABC-type multidrug transport system fused ATPase/permease subunit